MTTSPPLTPTEPMWGGLARDIVWWAMCETLHPGHSLHTHLRRLGRTIPTWLADEIPETAHTPPKGTIAVCIYRAMVEAA